MTIIYADRLFLSLLVLVLFTGQNVLSQEKSGSASVLSHSVFESDDVVSQWHSLATVVENFNGTLVRQAMYGEDKFEVLDKTEFKRKGNSTKSEVWRLKGKSSSLIKRGSYCSNPLYSFTLRNKPETGIGDNWNMLNVQKQTFDPEWDPVLNYETFSGPLAYMRMSHSLLGVPLWDLIRDEEFVLSNIRYADVDSKIISAEFSWKVPSSLVPRKSNFNRTVKGYLEFNTQKNWRIEKLFSCVSHNEGGKQVFLYLDNYLDYAETESGVPYVVKCTGYSSNIGHGKKELPATVHEMVDVNFTPAADNEFTLSHYGLPEPDFGERNVSWLRYILMTTGGLLIVYALWRMYRERKEKQQ